MTEYLVWILLATAGSSNGSSILPPIYFKTEAQCQHVAKQFYNLYAANKAKCVQANIYVPTGASK